MFMAFKEAYVILLMIAVAIVIWDIDIRAYVCDDGQWQWHEIRVERLSIKNPKKLKKVEALESYTTAKYL